MFFPFLFFDKTPPGAITPSRERGATQIEKNFGRTSQWQTIRK